MSASPGNLSKMQILGPQPRSPVSEIGGGSGGAEICVLTRLLAVLVHVSLSKEKAPCFSGPSLQLTSLTPSWPIPSSQVEVNQAVGMVTIAQFFVKRYKSSRMNIPLLI